MSEKTRQGRHLAGRCLDLNDSGRYGAHMTRRFLLTWFALAAMLLAFPQRSPAPLVYQPGEGWQHLNTEGMWETSVDLQPITANSPSR